MMMLLQNCIRVAAHDHAHLKRATQGAICSLDRKRCHSAHSLAGLLHAASACRELGCPRWKVHGLSGSYKQAVWCCTHAVMPWPTSNGWRGYWQSHNPNHGDPQCMQVSEATHKWHSKRPSSLLGNTSSSSRSLVQVSSTPLLSILYSRVLVMMHLVWAGQHSTRWNPPWWPQLRPAGHKVLWIGWTSWTDSSSFTLQASIWHRAQSLPRVSPEIAHACASSAGTSGCYPAMYSKLSRWRSICTCMCPSFPRTDYRAQARK